MTRKKKTPYETLGVDPKASGDTIKKAHRKRAMETHPDRGGDPDEFKAVQNSYMVLNDPTRRKRYDETGDDSQPNPKEASAVQTLVSSTFLEIVLQHHNQGVLIEKVDLMTLVKNRFKQEIDTKCRISALNVQRAKDTLTKTKRRLKDPGGLIASTLDFEISNCDTQLKNIEDRKRLLNEALTYLSECGFEFDKPPKYHRDSTDTEVSFT